MLPPSLFFSEKCDEPLVSGLSHVAFSSSSSMSASYSPGYAKINKRGGKQLLSLISASVLNKKFYIYRYSGILYIAAYNSVLKTSP